MLERLWQPSTGTQAPLTQPARGDGEERDDVADFVGGAEAAERQLAADEVGDAFGIGLLPRDATSRRGRGSIRARRC